MKLGNVIELPRRKYTHEQEKFLRWIKEAGKNERYLYHTGQYIVGSPMGRIAIEGYENGEIVLFQRKLESGYEYWAEKIKPYLY